MANSTLTFEQLRRSAEQQLRDIGIESAGIDVKLLMMSAANFDAAQLIFNAKTIVPSNVEGLFSKMLERRLKHEPVAYILGKKEFWSLEFAVSKHVLIPRPETELVVELALERIATVKKPKILDVGTGSGAILISLLHERKEAKGLGCDISQKALDIATENAKVLGVDERADFKRFDYLEGVNEVFDLVVSNPPYITDQAMIDLSNDVNEFEPHLALRGGDDGLDAYRSIISNVSKVLKPAGWVVLEIGYDQAAAVTSLFEANGFGQISVEKDLAGHDRVVCGKISA
jgi:release factor glutamine methyltransferase